MSLAKTLTNLMTLPTLGWRKINHTTSGTGGVATSLAPPAIAISGITAANGLATVTTSAAHRLKSGMVVTIAGADQPEYNITAQITVTGDTTFTYKLWQTDDPADATTSSSLTASYNAYAQRALVTVPGSTAVTLGPDADADYKSLVSGDEYLIECPNGARFDLADWYVKSSGTSQTVQVLYV